MFRKTAFVITALLIVCALTSITVAAEQLTRKSQTVFVSAYPHVFMGPRATVFDLGVTLVIRNTDFKTPITITSIDYYDTQGRLTKKYLTGPLTISPMASKETHISEKDTSGGIGSNFIVRWKADREVNVPIIEAVMIGGKSGQGISFISEGREISE